MHLTLALLHFVWQGALIVGGSVLAVWLLGRGSPQRRYRIYLTAMVLMLLCLPVTLGVVVRWNSDRELPAASSDASGLMAGRDRTLERRRADQLRRSSEVSLHESPLPFQRGRRDATRDR